MTIRDLEELRLHPELSPYQGPDKLGKKMLPLPGVSGLGKNWRPFELKEWTPDKKATKGQSEHIDMSQRVWRHGDLEFTFWALAHVDPGVRRWRGGGLPASAIECVWLILTLPGGSRSMHYALVVKDSDKVLWYDDGRAFGHVDLEEKPA
jgi:hypothetical protein